MKVLVASREKVELTNDLITRPHPEIDKNDDGVKEVSNIITKPKRTAVIDISKLPKRYLMEHIQGTPWTVEFYNPLLGKDDVAADFDPTVTNPSQQYERINSLVLRIKNGISWSQDDKDKSFDVVGSSSVANSVIPAKGAFFIADIGDARKGIFKITSIARPSYNKIATYEIDYTLAYVLTPEIEQVISRCTARTFYFVADRAWVSEETLLTEDEYNSFLAINLEIAKIENIYVKQFYDNDARSLIIPQSELLTNKLYDVFLSVFVRAIGINVSTKDITIYPHPPYIIDDIETLWSMILLQDHSVLYRVRKDMGGYRAATFRREQTYNSVGYSRITFTLFPPASVRYGEMSNYDPDYEEVPVINKTFNGSGLDTLPLFTTPKLSPYVLTESFYNGSYGSVLEYGLMLYLTRQKLRTDVALELSRNLKELPEVALLYFTPIVYVLLKYARQT